MAKRERIYETATIYGLVDPRDGMLRYIGQTVSPLKKRLSSHVSGISHWCHGGVEKNRWIGELVDAGLMPETLEIEVVPFSDRLNAEKRWIEYFALLGYDLLNGCMSSLSGPEKKRAMAEWILDRNLRKPGDYDAQFRVAVAMRRLEELDSKQAKAQA